MYKAFKRYIEPLNDELARDLGLVDTEEPTYQTWVDDDNVRHVNIQHVVGDYVIWDIRKGKMVKQFDFEEKPF